MDYFNPSDSLIFFDELTRCTEQGKLTETEFSESMKQRLAMGYILPGQMNGLFYREGDSGKAWEVFVHRTRCA